MVLPARFPNVLVCSSGTRSQWHNIPPHNLCEVIDSTLP